MIAEFLSTGFPHSELRHFESLDDSIVIKSCLMKLRTVIDSIGMSAATCVTARNKKVIT